MRRGDVDTLHEVGSQPGLVLPRVHDGAGDRALLQGGEEGVGIHDLTPGGIDKDRSGLEPREETLVRQVKRLVGRLERQGNMQGDDIRLREHVVERGKDGFPLSGGLVSRPGRIVEAGTHAERPGFLRDQAADVADADDGDRFAGEWRPVRGGEMKQGGCDIFGHAVGIAAGGGAPADPGGIKERGVHVVGPDRGRADEADAATVEQAAVHARGRADGKHIGVANIGGGDGSPVEDHGVAECSERLAGERHGR